MKLLGERSKSNTDDNVWFVMYREILLFFIILPSTINFVSTKKDFWSYGVLLHRTNVNRSMVMILRVVFISAPKILMDYKQKISLREKSMKMLWKIKEGKNGGVCLIWFLVIFAIIIIFTVTASSKLK